MLNLDLDLTTSIVIMNTIEDDDYGFLNRKGSGTRCRNITYSADNIVLFLNLPSLYIY